MARAVCMDCGFVIRWRARRGARLSKLKCSKCGGRLRAYRAKQDDLPDGSIPAYIINRGLPCVAQRRRTENG